MFKLIFLTLLAFVVVLTVFGDGEGRRVAQPEPQAAAASTPDPDSPDAEAAAEAAAERAAEESAAAVEQTPEQQPKFAGPDLRPSPEFAGQEPQETLSDAPTDTLYVTGNTVNFRAGPSTSDQVVGRLSRGQMVTAIGTRDGDWIELRDGQGRTGFMSAQFLSASRP
ncbi:SH3 domain-containing protein [Paracoccus isoporae]|uniref:SH3 domain-containing protein n=1 Tax=Paracoccus isoporae TaxID=591205 RepID=A0A1G7C791_9RHOB|nr:SH3 domain-containing protein [Paracoccus isoporae]SDE35073.1 SH3 domain-containing protein [Paracoccus isoporae]